jgi:hypothetical protein
MTTTSDFKRKRKLEKLWVELEWRKCAKDKNYFIKNYVYIQVQSKWDARGRMKFDLFDYQENALNTWNNNRFVIIVKARQLGYTTLAMADILWHCLFQPGSNLLLVSKNQDSANKNLGMVKFMYQFLPAWMKERGPRLIKDAEYKLEYEYADGMKCQVKSFAGTETAGAGETATLVVLDEFALMEDPENTYRTILPTTDAGGRLIIISTARGAYNQFAKLYRAAKQNQNQFVPLFQPWHSSRLITMEEYESKRRDFLSEPWLFYAEYPSSDTEAFRESGNPRFPDLPADGNNNFIRGNLVETDKSIEFVYDEDGRFYVLEDVIDNQVSYFIGADPAQGRGGDFSTAHVLAVDIDNRPYIAGYYRSNMVEPVQFAADLDLLGRFFTGPYGAAMLAVEDQGGQGQLPINELHRTLNYPNPYVFRQTGRKGTTRSTRLFSFPMTPDRRKMVIDKLAEYVACINGEPTIKNIHTDLLEELSQFVRQETPGGNVKYAADVGCHDDLVLSLAIALWALVENTDLNAPQTRDNETTPKQVVYLTRMHEIRERNIAEAEAAIEEAWASFQSDWNY